MYRDVTIVFYQKFNANSSYIKIYVKIPPIDILIIAIEIDASALEKKKSIGLRKQRLNGNYLCCGLVTFKEAMNKKQRNAKVA